MNNRSIFQALAIGALVLAVAAAVAVGAYNAGMSHGLAEAARALPPQAGAAPVPYYPYWGRPWGFGFFPIFPFFFLILLLFFVVRGLFWRGRWRGGWGHRYEGVPPMFEEWHRRAHAQQPPAPPAAGTTA